MKTPGILPLLTISLGIHSVDKKSTEVLIYGLEKQFWLEATQQSAEWDGNTNEGGKKDLQRKST